MTVGLHALQDLSLAADALARAAGWDDQPAPSLGQRLIAARRSGQRSVALSGGIRALSSASFAAELAVGQPMSLQAHRRRLFIRDLVPVLPSTTSFVPFVRELNPQSAEMGASGVAEGNSKPDASNGVAFSPVTITAGTLAASVTVTDQLWNDA
ncbi:MAG TPA: phage major capsid protein, partial [Acidothermaceae bacterium]